MVIIMDAICDICDFFKKKIPILFLTSTPTPFFSSSPLLSSLRFHSFLLFVSTPFFTYPDASLGCTIAGDLVLARGYPQVETGQVCHGGCEVYIHLFIA